MSANKAQIAQIKKIQTDRAILLIAAKIALESKASQADIKKTLEGAIKQAEMGYQPFIV